MCDKHYQYWYVHGVPTIQPERIHSLKISTADARWIAAVIDCEGTITVVRSRRTKSFAYNLHISVGNTEKSLLDEMRRILGLGVIVERDRPRPAKPIFHWHVWKRNEVLSICKSILPHLILKRENARILVEEWPNKNAKNGSQRERITEKLHALNAKGR